jgi:DNA-binding NtrC family response regulator
MERNLLFHGTQELEYRRMVDVLLCDKDPGSLRFLEAILKTENFEVESFAHLSQVVASCSRRKYKMTIISLSHKGRWGTEERLEPLRVIRELDPGMPIVVVCDQESLEMERKLREIGIFYLLTKPLSSEELQDAVKCAIEKHKKKSGSGEKHAN